ncbi:MAG TPA: hypothetical protein DCQ06_14480 [Myxococcales bacterium]|nr:hypothetical protein [Myxococcales bacterium]
MDRSYGHGSADNAADPKGTYVAMARNTYWKNRAERSNTSSVKRSQGLGKNLARLAVAATCQVSRSMDNAQLVWRVLGVSSIPEADLSPSAPDAIRPV